MADFQEKILGTSDEEINEVMKIQNVTQRVVEEGMESIKDWYKKQPHLPQEAIDNYQFILRFYATCSFSIERAKEKIDNFYTARTIIPELLSNRDPFSPQIINTINSLHWGLMPKLTPERYRFIVCRYTDSPIELYNPIDCFKMCFMFSDLRIRYETCLGDIYVFDLTNMKFGHALKMTPPLIKKLMFISQSCYGSKIKALHVINLPPFAESILNVAKKFMKKKIADRVQVHSNLEDLHKKISPDYLPEELGGTGDSCSSITRKLIEAMQSKEWSKWFLDSENIKSDESKRLEKSDDKVGDMLGIMGSFRKLDID